MRRGCSYYARNTHAHLSIQPLFEAFPVYKTEATLQRSRDLWACNVRLFRSFLCRNKHTKSALLGLGAKIKNVREGVGICDFLVEIFISNFFPVLR